MPPNTPLNRVACGVSAAWVVGRESKGLITPQEHPKLRSSTFAKALYAGSRNHQIPLQQESVWEKNLLVTDCWSSCRRQSAAPNAAGCTGESRCLAEAERWLPGGNACARRSGADLRVGSWHAWWRLASSVLIAKSKGGTVAPSGRVVYEKEGTQLQTLLQPGWLAGEPKSGLLSRRHPASRLSQFE